MVFRLFIEKKRGLEASSKRLLGHIKEYTSLETETELREFDRYDFDGISKEEFNVISENILCDENNETAFVDYLPLMSEWKFFTVEPRDGKYNQNLDYIKQTVKSCGINKSYKIKIAKVIALSNILSESKMTEIQNLLIDNNIYQTADNNKPLSIEDPEIIFGDSAVPENFIEMNDIQIYQYLGTTVLKMSKEMLCNVRDFYQSVKRNPTTVELFAIDSYLSKNKNVKNSRFHEINVEESATVSPLKITLDEFINMRNHTHYEKKGTISLNDIAMAGYEFMKQKGQIQDIVIEDDNPLIQMPVDVNGVVEQYLIGFNATKVPSTKEFDNYPTSVGNLNSHGLTSYQSLDINLKKSISKKDRLAKTNYYSTSTKADVITNKIANQNKILGIPTMLGNEIYSESVNEPVNFCATACASTKYNFKNRISTGDAIIMLGSKMRYEDIGSTKFVQINNSVTKEKISQFFKNENSMPLIKKIVGFDNGLVSGVCEIEKGVSLDINRIVASKNLRFAHLAISTPNERIAIVVDNNNIEKIKDICVKIGLSSHTIGEISDEQYLIIKNGKKQVADIPYQFIETLNDNQKLAVSILDNTNKRVFFKKADDEFTQMEFKDAFIKNLKNISNCSKKGVASQFDSTVGGGCVLAPYGGINVITPSESFVCKIPTQTGNTSTVTAIAYGCTPKLTKLNPYHGTAFSIMECLSKIVAVGANSISAKLAICQSISNPETYASKWGKAFSSLFGAFATETGMDIPAISYECSINENTDDELSFSCFGIATSKSNEVISAEFKSVGSTIILVPMPTVLRTGLPDFDKAKVMYRQLHYLSQNGKVLSAGVVGDGSIAALVAKMSFGNGIGVDFEQLSNDVLFSPLTASIVVETQNPGAFSGMDTITIGHTTSEPTFRYDTTVIQLNEAMAAYNSVIQSVYPTKTSKKIAMTKIPIFNDEEVKTSNIQVAKPKVVIPVFSTFAGANDCKRSFEKHGAEVEIVFLNHKNLGNSIKNLAEKIDDSQILCLPSGEGIKFSSTYGYNIMKTPQIQESVMNLLNNNNGLILGIEEGFDILLRCGLLVDGRYKTNESGAYLAENITGTFIDGFASTKIISNISPWLSLCETGDIYTVPVSHLKGRFVVDESTMILLMNNHQIATQYVDKNAKPASKLPFNPDGSICAVESITSKDGRIFGKMGQSQRRTRNCFTNISGNKDQRIFEAGIKYFN